MAQGVFNPVIVSEKDNHAFLVSSEQTTSPVKITRSGFSLATTFLTITMALSDRYESYLKWTSVNCTIFNFPSGLNFKTGFDVFPVENDSIETVIKAKTRVMSFFIFDMIIIELFIFMPNGRDFSWFVVFRKIPEIQ